MKKIIISVLTTVLIITLAGCAGKSQDPASGDKQNPQTNDISSVEKKPQAEVIESQTFSVDKLFAGEWVGVDNKEKWGTTMVIENLPDSSLKCSVNAFYINAANSPNSGRITGKGSFKDGGLIFKVDDGNLSWDIKCEGDRLLVKYNGDITSYAGIGVVFSEEFKRKVK